MNRATATAIGTGIEIDSVTKRYGETTVVRDVSLTVPHGGITALIGANGAGKSTLLSMMSRLLPMDSGRISVDGLDVTSTASDIIAKKLSILRQDNHLAVRLTVRDLVTFGRYPHSRGRPTVEDRDHIERAIDYLDLRGLEDRFLDQLSGGQRQRAFVAMVLCQDTDYVLLDEPLNNLDMAHSVSMMRQLRRTADELGKTIVIVIHDINFASCYADTIVAMRDGELVLQGSPEEMMQPDALSAVFGIDIAVHEINGNRFGLYFT